MAVGQQPTEQQPTQQDGVGRPRRRKRWPFVLVGAVVAAVVLVVGGTFLYINVISEDAPEEFSLNDQAASAAPAPTGSVEGTWTVAAGSEAGYRVDEVLFGQNKTAAGRTSEVTGEMTITGTKLEAATFTVQMANVTTDEDRRDNQFRGRIMDVETYPTSTFVLTEPLDLAPVPEDATPASYSATGELTLHGTTKVVTIELQTLRTGDQIEVVGQLPIVFADYGIPNPSLPGISTEDNGVMEVDLVFGKA